MAIFEITFLFLGSIIGAGFATGAEIVTFFGKFHLPIWLIAAVVGLGMFLVITAEVLIYSRPKTPQTPRKHGKFLNVVFVMIYLILFTAMTAGMIQITNIFIGVISLLLSATIAQFNIQKLSHFNSLLVLVIITLIITTALPHASTSINSPIALNQIPVLTTWALLYAGLNCFTFPELIQATAQRYPQRTIIAAGALTAVIVTVLVGFILSTIQATHTSTTPIPLLAAVPTHTTFLIILFAVLTSQYTTLFAINQRAQQIFPTIKNKPRITTACFCFCALIGSYCGFNRIVQFGYPLIGAITCFYLMFSFLQRFLRFSFQR